MTSIKQGHQLEIGFKPYGIGRILSLTPEQIQIEVLLQDTPALRGLPFSLKRIDTFENGVVKEVQVFDGWVKNAVAMPEQSVTTYSIITAESQVYTALQQTLLHTVKAEASQEELLLTEVHTRTGASFLVPDAQSLMAELLTKRTSDFYPSYIASYLIESVMHKDAVGLYKELKQCIREFDANKAGVPDSLKDKEQVMNIVLSGVNKVNDMLAIENEKPYLWRSSGTNFITLQSSAFHYSWNTTIDQTVVASDLFDKNLLTANILYFLIVKGTTGLFPEVLSRDVFIKTWNSFIAEVSSVSVGNGITYVDMELIINSRIDEILNFDDIPVWYDYKDKKVWFENAEYNKHTYLKTTLEKFISENQAFFKHFSKGGGVDIDKYRSMIMKSSFVRAGTNAGTLRYWNGRVSEKIVDTSRLHVSHKNPFEVLNTITKRAGMDIMRRQMQYASEGSLMNVLTTFYSSYFMRINACFPAKGYTAEGTAMTGSFMVSMNNSMGIAPSYFIPLELWQTSGFTAAARPDREEYYFFVRDKVLRDLIEKDSPPYLFNYKDGWGQLIEIGNMDDFFAKDYLRSLYRAPVIAELTIDRTLLSALTDQNEESRSKAFETQSVKNEIVDPVVIMKSYFERMFKRYYESITGTSDTDKVFQASPIDLTSFKLFFDIYVKYLKLAESVTNPLSTQVLAGALLNSFSLYDTLAGSAWGTHAFGWTEEEFKQVGTFYPTIEQYSSTSWESSRDAEKLLTDSISAYLLSIDDVDTGNPLNYELSDFYKDFCRDKPFTHKSDHGFVRFMEYLHAAEGGDAINTMDGTPELQMPSRYGLQIDKLFPFVKYHCGNNAIAGDEFGEYTHRYSAAVKAFYSKNGKKPSRKQAEEIINQITAVNTYTAKLFRSFMTFSKDEASEITYWVMFRGGSAGLNGSALLRGEKNRPGFKLISYLLDAYYQHGPSANAKFVKWYNDLEPKYNASNPYKNIRWDKMPESDRAMWKSITNMESLPESTSLSNICRLLATNNGFNMDACVDSLKRFRGFALLEAKPQAGYETSRFNPLVDFVNSLSSSDGVVKTGTVKVPETYDPVLPTVTAMLTESLDRLQDIIIEGKQLVTSSGLPSNIGNFKSMLQSFLTSEPGVELAATLPNQAPSDQPLMDTVAKTLSGGSDEKTGVKINVLVGSSVVSVDVGVSKSSSVQKQELFSGEKDSTIAKASAILAYSCGSYLIQKAVYSDKPYVFSSIADIYDHYLSKDDYNAAVLEAKGNIHTMIVKRYKNPKIDVSTLSAKERHTLGSLKNLYFIDSIINNVLARMKTSFIKYQSQDMKEQVLKGISSSSTLCTNMIGLAERLIMSDDFLVRLGSDVETALLRSPVQPVQEGSSMLSNLSMSVDKSGSVVKDLKAYGITAATMSFAGSDILDLKYITPESRAQTLLNKTGDVNSMDSAIGVLIKLISLYLFYKIKWGSTVTVETFIDKVYSEPVQKFSKDFTVANSGIPNLDKLETALNSRGYKIKLFATEKLFEGVFKTEDVAYKRKYGSVNIKKGSIEAKWNTKGVGVGTYLEKFTELDDFITGSLRRYNKQQDLIDAVTMWNIIKTGNSPLVIFYSRLADNDNDIYCGVAVDLSSEQSYIEFIRSKTKDSSSIPVVINLVD